MFIVMCTFTVMMEGGKEEGRMLSKIVSVTQRKSYGFLNLYISLLSLPFLRDGKIINIGLLHVIILYLLTYLTSPIT